MLHYNVAEKIRKFVFAYPEGVLFTTRDLTHLGNRNVVDQTLTRLARLGIILRITRGVFMRETADGWRPSVMQVATAKADAYCKDILPVLPDSPHYENNENETVFLCANGSGSFKYGNHTIRFKRISARKFELLSEERETATKTSYLDFSPQPDTKKLSADSFTPDYDEWLALPSEKLVSEFQAYNYALHA